jgi:eukaryotic-like serine/threonine-protein kinase
VSLTSGSRLGPYEILTPLGAGGMGEVYSARDSRLDRTVAIKILPAAVARDPAAMARFEREAKAVASLSHPNILSIFDFGREADTSYAVTELLTGETLRDKIGQHALPQRKVVDYGAQIARGLAAAHEKGIAHRDLKPENVFVTSDGRVKILDFGLARQTLALAATDTVSPTYARLTDPGTVLGTVGYMSPEQVRGEPGDHRSDIFSLGAVLYELTTGRRAFQRGTAAETMTAILREDPPQLAPDAGSSEMTPGFARIVAHCLEKAPAERFQSASDIAFALNAITGSSATSVSAIAVPARKPRRAAGMAIVAVAIAVVAAAAFWAGLRKATSQPDVTYQRLTFRRGAIASARFDPDGRTVVYSAAFEGAPLSLYSTRLDSRDSRSLDLKLDVQSISSTGEMALLERAEALGGDVEHGMPGTLTQASVAGGAPRRMLDTVVSADWSPDGKRLAAVHVAGGKSRVEYPLGRVRYETANQVYRVRVSPRDDRLAFNEKAVGFGTNWTLKVLDADGRIRTLPTGVSADFIDFAWSPSGDEIWFTETMGAASFDLRATTLDGRQRIVLPMPIGLRLFDVTADGRVLVGRSSLRSSVAGIRPGDDRERDYSWLDMSEADDVAPDGSFLVMTEYGEGGGIGRWSVFFRKTDGSAAVRIGEGQAFSLSPDGKSVLALRRGSPPSLAVLPIGAGQAADLKNPSGIDFAGAWWFPDGKTVLFLGQEAGHAPRYWAQPLGGDPRPITAEGVLGGSVLGTHPISPDGTAIALLDTEMRLAIQPVGGGALRTVTGPPDVSIVRWSADGRSVFVTTRAIPARILKVDVATGVRVPVREIVPQDPAGVANVYAVQLLDDGRSYFYSYQRELTDLYVIRGLR